MKNVKLLFIMALGVFLFVGCNTVSADDEVEEAASYRSSEMEAFNDRINEIENSIDESTTSEEAREMQEQIMELTQEILDYTLTRPNLYPAYCACPTTYTTDCPQWNLIEIRIMELRHQLGEIEYPDGAG